LEILPVKVSFAHAGETQQLTVIACWSDGSREDVTCLSRFRTNDESTAAVDENGLVTAIRAGDTHVVAFYDNGVTPVSVVTPVSELAGSRYPPIDTPTEIDRLVVDKLRELGIVPSELSSDAEFLRRVSLDMVGTLPTPAEIEAFLADSTADKRLRKIDELLTRPTYAAWWTTRLCDYTGNNAAQLKEGPFDGPRSSAQWYAWIFQRVAENRPYDEIVSGIVLGTSRYAGLTYDEYCQTMNRCYRDETGHEFAALPTMPHYWMMRNSRKPEQMAEAFAHSFLGIRLQCAQCHKHPFDQWTKRDYEDFAAVFRRVKFGVSPEAKPRFDEIQEQFRGEGKKKIDLAKEGAKLIAEDKAIPWREVFAARPGKAKGKPAAASPTPAAEPARLLEGETLDLAQYADPRQALVEWLRRDADRYFARALVNRVWAAYFQRGIIEPPDDLSRANPPCNEPLLDYLTHEFVAHGFDLKWLHRTIAGSRTYQLSWRPNETNRLDTRNFSHAVPRRLPAEVAYNAILQATARDEQLADLQLDFQHLATGPPAAKPQRPKGNYALTVFGRPTRAIPCDCDRSSEPTLLQTLFLQNDGEMLGLLDRPDGWVTQCSKQLAALEKAGALAQRLHAREQDLAELDRQIRAVDAVAGGQQRDRRRSALNSELAKLREQVNKVRSEVPPVIGSLDSAGLVRQAYLRTLSRPPIASETNRATQYLQAAADERTGLRDLQWALLNTKEFILNH
jgi:hypothetical protein